MSTHFSTIYNYSISMKSVMLKMFTHLHVKIHHFSQGPYASYEPNITEYLSTYSWKWVKRNEPSGKPRLWKKSRRVGKLFKWSRGKTILVHFPSHQRRYWFSGLCMFFLISFPCQTGCWFGGFVTHRTTSLKNIWRSFIYHSHPCMETKSFDRAWCMYQSYDPIACIQ